MLVFFFCKHPTCCLNQIHPRGSSAWKMLNGILALQPGKGKTWKTIASTQVGRRFDLMRYLFIFNISPWNYFRLKDLMLA